MADLPRPDAKGMDRLKQVMVQLRDPETGCPWDVAQSHASIARYAIEEAYEVVDAIERGNDEDLKDELGDLLLQVVFHARIAEERGAWNLDDVIDAICAKMIRRHPHVWGPNAASERAQGPIAWEDIKTAERAQKGNVAAGALDGVPLGLPAFIRAEKIGKKAARAGFDWPDAQAVLGKVREELDELEEVLDGPPERIDEELGDVLFSVANLTRKLGRDGETRLRAAIAKFEGRFGQVERSVMADGRAMSDHSAAELERYWQAAKNAAD